jgi:hypothetical protein
MFFEGKYSSHQVMGVVLIADDLNAGAKWMETQVGLVTWRSPLAASEYTKD